MTFPDLHHRMCCDECDVMRDRLPDYLAAVEAARAREETEERLADAEEVRDEFVTPEHIRLITRLRTERAEAILAARAALARLRDEVPA